MTIEQISEKLTNVSYAMTMDGYQPTEKEVNELFQMAGKALGTNVFDLISEEENKTQELGKMDMQDRIDFVSDLCFHSQIAKMQREL